MKHLTVEQTAEVLGLTPKAVRQRISRGQLPFRKLGKRVLVPAVELEKFLFALPGRAEGGRSRSGGGQVMVETQRPLAGKASGHAQQRTGFTGSADAVSVGKCTTAPQTPSSWKAYAVALLSEVFEFDPALGIAWACIIQTRFPWFVEA